MTKRMTICVTCCLMTVISCAETEPQAQTGDGTEAVVYFTKEITPEALTGVFKALKVPTKDKRVAVKISTGESNNSNHLRPALIKDLVAETGGKLVECNIAIGGNRYRTADHQRAVRERGYDEIGGVDIMDADGEIQIPVRDKKWIQYDLVGSHLTNYDMMINLAHFKGHAIGGFGGVLKNQSIGVASSRGKTYIHTSGRSLTDFWTYLYDNQDGFLESMAAAAQAVHDYFKQEGRDIVYINVMNNISVDCDCDPSPEAPRMKDVGILASLDPVALDRACLDLVFSHESVAGDDASPLISRIKERHGTHIVDYAEQIGLGTQAYKMISLDEPSAVEGTPTVGTLLYNVYTLDGKKVVTNAQSLEGLPKGTYIVNGSKRIIE